MYRQCIYVINHQSLIDSIVVSHLWKEPCSVIVKDSLKYVGLGWPMMHFTKVLPIARNDHTKAMATMRTALDMIQNEHITMFVFPEGTRNRNGDHLLPFKKGAFHLAIQSQLPIFPVVISSYKSFLDHKNKVFDDAAYGVYILKPILTEGLTSADAGSLMQQTFDAMSEVFELTTLVSKEDLGRDVREMKEVLEPKKAGVKSREGKEEKEKVPPVEQSKLENPVDNQIKTAN
nr:1 acyl sn glycerol 3 phosphate acyltransferase [Hymenolepis microstoma]